MNTLTVTLAAYAATVAFSLSPWGEARAQMDTAPVEAGATHGDWTLRQREDWLNDRLDKSRANGTLDREQFDMAKHEMADLRREETMLRDHAHGQLTDNQTADLEERLDTMAAKIHWANEAAYTRPW